MKHFTMTATDALGARPTASGAGLTVRDGGRIEQGDDSVPVSLVPTVRMAGDAWAEIFEGLRAQEQGQDLQMVVRPGGIIVRDDGASGDAQPVSVVPKVRMASGSVLDEAEELARLDPHREEGWKHVRSRNGEVEGWKFDLNAPYHGRPFSFLTFRNPARGNGWEISPLWPNLDDQFGHLAHMVRVQMGDQTVPVLCGPGGRPARDLTEVRGVAAKWTAYT